MGALPLTHSPSGPPRAPGGPKNRGKIAENRAPGPPRALGGHFRPAGAISRIFSKPSQKMRFLAFLGSKMVQKKVEFEGVGPIWRDPRRNSVQKAVPGVPYGGMATHLVTKRCDFGSLGVPGPASTPRLGPGGVLGGSWGGRAAGGGGRAARMCARKSEPAVFPTFPLYFPHPKSLPRAAGGPV